MSHGVSLTTFTTEVSKYALFLKKKPIFANMLTMMQHIFFFFCWIFLLLCQLICWKTRMDCCRIGQGSVTLGPVAFVLSQFGILGARSASTLGNCDHVNPTRNSFPTSIAIFAIPLYTNPPALHRLSPALDRNQFKCRLKIENSLVVAKQILAGICVSRWKIIQ